MKKFGIFVIKPDAINGHDLSIIQYVLDQYGFCKTLCFNMANYCDVMTEYRKEDIVFKNFYNAEEEIKGCGVALSAYKELYQDADGLLLLIPLGGETFEEFYDKANKAKKDIRRQIEQDRGYCYAYVNYTTAPKLTKLTHEEYRMLKDKDKSDINKAYINGVHLEDFECLENNFCLNFMVKNGIISKNNKILLQDLILSLQS